MQRFVVVPVWTLSLVLLLAFSFSQNSPKAIAQGEDPFDKTPSISESIKEAPSVVGEIGTPPPKDPQIWADVDYDHEANALIREKLHGDLTNAGLDFQETPLIEVVDFLRDEYELNIQIDQQRLDVFAISLDVPVTVNLRNVKLGAALRFMLKPLYLTTVIQDGMLIITSEPKAMDCLKVAIYPVNDLLSAHEKSSDELTGTIVQGIACESWAINGGGFAEILFIPTISAIVISQTEDAHRGVLSLLTALRGSEGNFDRKTAFSPADSCGDGVTSPKRPQIWACDDYDHDANACIRRQLQVDLTNGGLNFKETPLAKVVDYLRDEYQLEIIIDKPGIFSEGVKEDDPITLNIKNAKLGAALRIMLKSLQLKAVTHDGMLVITSDSRDRYYMKTAVYPVFDLIDVNDDSINKLRHAIVRFISQGSWGENGGGIAEMSFMSQRGALVIYQTKKAHSQILTMLNALRDCRGL